MGTVIASGVTFGKMIRKRMDCLLWVGAPSSFYLTFTACRTVTECESNCQTHLNRVYFGTGLETSEQKDKGVIDQSGKEGNLHGKQGLPLRDLSDG